MDKKVKKIKTKIILPSNKPANFLKVESGYKNKFVNLLKSVDSVIVFSSHLDDAVLSAGSLLSYLSQSKIKVKIVNVFTAGFEIQTKSTKTILQKAKIDNVRDYFRLRKAEDKKAFAGLGINRIINLNFPDGAFRVDQNGEPIYPNNQVGVEIKDQKQFKASLLNSLRDLNINTKSVVFAPLALGRHVDHVLARNSISKIFNKKVIYYEDYPYSYYFQERFDIKDVPHYESLPQRAHHENEDKFIKENKLIAVRWNGDYQIKKKAILQYRTQKESLFSNGLMILPLEKFYLQKKFLEV